MTDIFNKLKTHIENKTGSSTFLELSGNCEMMLSGCTAIDEYGPDEIKVNTVLGKISVMGENLHLSVYREDILTVNGKVNMIKLGGSK